VGDQRGIRRRHDGRNARTPSAAREGEHPRRCLRTWPSDRRVGRAHRRHVAGRPAQDGRQTRRCVALHRWRRGDGACDRDGLMFGTQNLGLFIITALVLNATPGVDLLLTLSRTLQGGVRAGLATALGISSGCVVHTLAAALGIAALLAASALAFGIIKWL